MPLAFIRSLATKVMIFFFAGFFLSSTSYGFLTPERLIFDLTWTGVKAGTSTLEITSDENTMKIVSTAKSADWVSLFYTVDDRIESVLSRAKAPFVIGAPQTYRVKVREGKHRRDKEVTFDQLKHTAVYVDHIGGEKKDIDLRNDVFDPLSGFYYVRVSKLEVGKSVYVDILDNKKLWNVEVQVLRKEKIKTVLGSFETIVIKPLMKSEGIFNRKGDMYIWLTDDDKRLPVKVSTKVAVGNVVATLVGGEY